MLNLTASMLRTYKACPRLYELEYIGCLKPAVTPGYFQTGQRYHEGVEHVLKGEPYETGGIEGIMVSAFERFVPWRNWLPARTEVEFDNGFLRGRVDALTADGTPVEHKTTSNAVDEKYIWRLAWDDQISFYLLAMKQARMIYTACQKPAIKQRQGETAAECLERVKVWYGPDKARAFEVTRTPDELREFEDEIKRIAGEIEARKFFYRNPANCGHGCAYEAICFGYDEETLTGFVKKERVNEELCKF